MRQAMHRPPHQPNPTHVISTEMRNEEERVLGGRRQQKRRGRGGAGQKEKECSGREIQNDKVHEEREEEESLSQKKAPAELRPCWGLLAAHHSHGGGQRFSGPQWEADCKGGRPGCRGGCSRPGAISHLRPEDGGHLQDKKSQELVTPDSPCYERWEVHAGHQQAVTMIRQSKAAQPDQQRPALRKSETESYAMLARPVPITTLARILSWAQRMEKTTEHAPWLPLRRVVLVSPETRQDRPAKSKPCRTLFNKPGLAGLGPVVDVLSCAPKSCKCDSQSRAHT